MPAVHPFLGYTPHHTCTVHHHSECSVLEATLHITYIPDLHSPSPFIRLTYYVPVHSRSTFLHLLFVPTTPFVHSTFYDDSDGRPVDSIPFTFIPTLFIPPPTNIRWCLGAIPAVHALPPATTPRTCATAWVTPWMGICYVALLHILHIPDSTCIRLHSITICWFIRSLFHSRSTIYMVTFLLLLTILHSIYHLLPHSIWNCSIPDSTRYHHSRFYHYTHLDSLPMPLPGRALFPVLTLHLLFPLRFTIHSVYDLPHSGDSLHSTTLTLLLHIPIADSYIYIRFHTFHTHVWVHVWFLPAPPPLPHVAGTAALRVPFWVPVPFLGPCCSPSLIDYSHIDSHSGAIVDVIPHLFLYYIYIYYLFILEVFDLFLCCCSVPGGPFLGDLLQLLILTTDSPSSCSDYPIHSYTTFPYWLWIVHSFTLRSTALIRFTLLGTLR